MLLAGLGAALAARPAAARAGQGAQALTSEPASTPEHLVLLGDSIFDNGAYVRGGPDVVRQLREALPAGARATLLAVDGATTGGVLRQAERLPADATRLIVSAGGNDALGASGVFAEPARSMAEAVERLAGIAERFERGYAAMLDGLLAFQRPLAACTIYDPRYPDPLRQRLAVTGLMLFNDAILRQAAARGLAVIDLRLVCDRDEDYANPIEPSSRGGLKIAAAIARWAAEPPAARTVVLAR